MLDSNCIVLLCTGKTMIRLVDGSGTADPPRSGRLDVFYGEWGAVCNASGSFNTAAASVVCRELGLGVKGVALTAAAEAVMGATPNQGSAVQQVWLDGVGCSGSESHLDDCPHSVVGTYDCDPSDIVFVSCK
jgi:hypothetical protein